MGRVKTRDDIAAMREGGAMLAQVLQLMKSTAAPGMTGIDLAQLATKELKSLGGEPAFLGVDGGPGVRPFPDVICISISEEVQHGIPSSRVIVDGDVINFDFGVKHKGLITDAGLTVGIGTISEDAKRLLEGTQAALRAGMDQLKEGASVFDVSGAIEDTLENYRLGIVLELVGHGVGDSLHEIPEIPNYRTRGRQHIFKAGETVCIEPIATLGSGRIVFADDGWTILSADSTLSAQFEHTLLVKKDGCEPLTLIS
ncbi:MAG: type I methionyl aminopeptidase [Patescibacteria group bacterium]